MISNEKTYATFVQRYWKEACSGNMQTIVFLHNSRNIPSSYITPFLPLSAPGKTTTELKIVKLKESSYHPYMPFLPWIREFFSGYKEADLDKILEDNDVYIPQRDSIKAYIYGRQPDISYDIEYSDNQYYVWRIREAIRKLLSIYFKDKPAIIILENAHLLPSSTMDLIVSEDNENIPILLILLGPSYSLPANSEWRDFIKNLGNRGLIVEINESFGIEKNEKTKKNCDFHKGIKSTYFCILLGAFKDAKEQIHDLYELYKQTPAAFSAQEVMTIFELLGKSHYYSQEYSNAQTHFHSLCELSKQEGDIKNEIIAHYFFGLCEMHIERSANSRAFIKEGLELSRKFGYKELIFKGLLYSIIAERRLGLKRQKGEEEKYKLFIELGEELENWDSLTILMANPFYLSAATQKQLRYELIDRAIGLARKVGNKKRIAYAHMALGRIMIEDGDYKHAEISMLKSLDLTKEIGDQTEYPSIYNALGYFYFKTGKYQQAHSLFLKSLQLLEDAVNIREIYLTIFNLTINAYISGDLQQAGLLYPMLKEILNFINPDISSFHSFSMIYALFGLINIKSGNIHKAYEFMMYSLAERKPKERQLRDERIFFALFEALATENENDIESAEELFNYCMDQIKKYNGELNYLAPHFAYEYALFSIRNNKDCDKIVKWGIKEALKCGNLHYKYCLENIGPYEKPLISLASPESAYSSEIEWILRSVRLRSEINNLYQNISDIDFIMTLQNIISITENEKILISRFSNLIFQSYKVSQIWIFSESANSRERLYPESCDTELESNILNLLDELKKTNPRGIWAPFVKERTEWNNLKLDISSFVYAPAIHGENWNLHVLCSADSEIKYLREDLKHVLSIAVKQLMIAIENIRQKMEITEKNRALSRAASTDALTNLNNRAALDERLKEEINRVKRYGSAKVKDFCLLFIDLDNFKHYNDTFGHQIGDYVLAAFGQILKQTAREVDFVARFGGDEFIMLLPETTIKGAKQVCDRLLEKLRENNGFIEQISLYLDREVYLEEDKYLSCSIGVVNYNCIRNYSVDLIFQKADAALYKAKNNGKSRYIIASS